VKDHIPDIEKML